MDSKVCFYREWLILPKNDFRILAMLAEQGGSFKGSLADMCRLLNITPGQSKHNVKLRTSIETLTANGYISHQKEDRCQVCPGQHYITRAGGAKPPAYFCYAPFPFVGRGFFIVSGTVHKTVLQNKNLISWDSEPHYTTFEKNSFYFPIKGAPVMPKSTK